MKLLKVLAVCLACVTSLNCFASVEGLGDEIEEVTKNSNSEIKIVENSSEDINWQAQLYIQAKLEQMPHLKNSQDQEYSRLNKPH